MAALQPPGKLLKTSCGSPHYASPEIAQGQRYQGDRADIWSCGVVLYVMLCGVLPFGTGHPSESVEDVLNEVIHADVMFPSHVSVEAQDLMLRMLQKAPKHRISIDQMWNHALLRKYDAFTRHKKYASQWIGGPPRELTVADCGQMIQDPGDIDLEILKSLCTLWHSISEETLVSSLLSDM